MTTPEPTGSNRTTREPSNAPCASNRGPVTPSLNTPKGAEAAEESIGVDMVKLNLPLLVPRHEEGLDAVGDGGSLMPHADSLDARGFSFEIAGMRVLVWTYMSDGMLMASVRFNPARHALNPRVWGGCPINMLPVLIEQVWWEMQEYLCPAVALAEAECTRLDINRDFILTGAERTAILLAASRVPVPRATRRTLWMSSKGTPESLYAFTKSQGGVRGYDHHGHHHTSPPGTFRVEAQIHQRRLNKAGISTVSDLGPSTIGDLFRERFEWSGFGTPVVYRHARIERIWNLAQDPGQPLTPLQAQRLIGVEALQQAGIKIPEGTTTLSARNALRAALGAAHDSLDAPTVIRLDPAYDQPVKDAA